MTDAALGGTAREISARRLAEVGLRFETDGEIATITLARPQRRNAQTLAVWSGLATIGENLPARVRVVVIRGEGPSFSSGIDLSVFAGGDGEGEGSEGDSPAAAARLGEAAIERLIADAQRGFLWLRRPHIVSIAAVQGHAIGAGFQLALACDLRVLADDARLCMKEATLGLVPDLTGTKPLVELAGLPRALELCLTARTVPAAEALRLGLAELVVPRAELDQAVADLTAAVLATGRDTATAIKRLLQGAPHRTLEEQAAAERGEQAARIRSLFASG